MKGTIASSNLSLSLRVTKQCAMKLGGPCTTCILLRQSHPLSRHRGASTPSLSAWRRRGRLSSATSPSYPIGSGRISWPSFLADTVVSSSHTRNENARGAIHEMLWQARERNLLCRQRVSLAASTLSRALSSRQSWRMKARDDCRPSAAEYHLHFNHGCAVASTRIFMNRSFDASSTISGILSSCHSGSFYHRNHPLKFHRRQDIFSIRLFCSNSSNNSNSNENELGKLDPKTNVQNDITSSAKKLPKETILEAIKSEVDRELGPSNPAPLSSSPMQPSELMDHEAPFDSVQKTPEDFARYLKGEEYIIDDGTGLRNLAAPRSASSNDDAVANENASVAATPLAAANAATASDDISETQQTSSKHQQFTNDDGETPTTATTTTTPFSYPFQKHHAALTTPQRHELRRRAMERKLEERQERSRAATSSNVRRALTGNVIIACAKLAAAVSSGSSAMLSEFVHSVVDCGNQALLLVGLNTSRYAPDRTHPYGYGKAIYFWALVSALGTFFLGAGVSMTHAVGELIEPSINAAEVPWEVWGVLGMSFAVDGYVFGKTVQGIRETMPETTPKLSFWKYATTKVRDPATLAVLLEDGAACLGVVLAIGGIGLTQYTEMPVFDALAGVGISGLLAAMGLALVSVNHRFLIGQGLDKATREGIEKIILSRRSIDNVYSVQSQWTGPDTFSYKAEVDFDGTFLAAKLMPRYQNEFLDAKDSLDRDLRVLLSWYAEDVMRAAEREVRHIEEEIRSKYPSAQYIELEPMSKDADRYAIDDGVEAQLRRVEIENLNRYLKSLYEISIKESDLRGESDGQAVTSQPQKSNEENKAN